MRTCIAFITLRDEQPGHVSVYSQHRLHNSAFRATIEQSHTQTYAILNIIYHFVNGEVTSWS